MCQFLDFVISLYVDGNVCPEIVGNSELISFRVIQPAASAQVTAMAAELGLTSE